MKKIFVFIVSIAFFAFPKISYAQTVIDNVSITNPSSGTVLLDLHSNYSINKIILTVSQSAKGQSIHEITAGPSLDSLSHVITLNSMLDNNQKVTIPLLKVIPNVRYTKITTSLAPSPFSWKDIQIFQGSTPTSNHLKYFGYYNITPADFDTMGNANIALIPSTDTEGLKAFINRGAVVVVRFSRYKSNEFDGPWGKFLSDIKGKEDKIWGFYIDEPFLQLDQDSFIHMTRTMHDKFPKKRIFVVEIHTSASHSNFPGDYFKYVTDIGFDYYFTRSTSPNNDDGWAGYLKYYEKFKPIFATKKVWLIPDGTGPLGTQTKWPDAFEKYLSLALTNDNTVGMAMFSFGNSDTPYSTSDRIHLANVLFPNAPGTYSYMPDFRNRLVEVGHEIIANTGTVPTKPGDINGDGAVNMTDFNLIKSSFGNPYTIYDYNNMVINYGK